MKKKLISPKLEKLVSDPNRFFLDFFRKRVNKTKVHVIGQRSTQSAAKKLSAADLNMVKQFGIPSFVISKLKCPHGVSDGTDPRSLLVNGCHVKDTLKLIDLIRCSFGLTTLLYDHERSAVIYADENALPLSNAASKEFSKASQFIIEFSDPKHELDTVLRIYLSDQTEDGYSALRSNHAWVKKLKLEEYSNLQSKYINDLCRKPIDAVITWVDCTDEGWQSAWNETYPDRPFDLDRFTSNEELRYSLRSINKYAPWFNKIFIVSNCERPLWLSKNDGKVQWVTHDEIFPSASTLPTFNSHAIESCLHRIRGLSENFVYFNDDFLISLPCRPNDFFDEYNRPILYFEECTPALSGSSHTETPDYLRASMNSSELIYESFKHRPRLQHKHVPYALKKSILEEMEVRFIHEFNTTRNSRTRSATDINVASFFFQHYIRATGRASTAKVANFTAKPHTAAKLLNYNSLKYKFICINDGGDSAKNSKYKELSKSFFEERYPELPIWEVCESISGD
ncbi:stealth conserved region 3 domain-containing protein [Pseudomonas sp. SWRI100]|uniref:stealth conserved region 3 domain-containing protein n=1 Tax=Pseudomonas TaxID=286 RepID=UPI0016494816|nr:MULTISPECIES: stealth conserved region 3 domain-containing protein [Pseudomonas]MBC3498848.1 stealth conserved region 3 domain-containing protein [Pseudomonas sp. SWRI67]MBV4525491.1 stealth conserved region 3 domain-containing protein [Pseudomonas kermanshahensis]